jgi:hypothetical protein
MSRARALIPVFLLASLWAGTSYAAGEPAGDGPGSGGGLSEVRITQLVAAITAIGALGTAAFGLVDAFKALGGGVSNFGLGGIYRVVSRFSAALELALGSDENGKPEWRSVVRAHWINGRPRDQQKAIVKSLIRLGIAPETVVPLAKYGHVREEALRDVAAKLAQGIAPDETDRNVLGRLDASIDAQLDAAFDRADQLYRNMSRLFAAGVAVALGFVATWALGESNGWKSLIVGVLAVPLAPIAKDLASSLQASAAAMRAVK